MGSYFDLNTKKEILSSVSGAACATEVAFQSGLCSNIVCAIPALGNKLEHYLEIRRENNDYLIKGYVKQICRGYLYKLI